MAKPIVSKGDRVLAGQKLAEAVGVVSASVFCTVSVTVKAIEPRRVVTGDNVMSIVVENDGLYEEVEYPKVKPLAELSREEILERIKEAGVVGMGGAGFPTHVKLAPKMCIRDRSYNHRTHDPAGIVLSPYMRVGRNFHQIAHVLVPLFLLFAVRQNRPPHGFDRLRQLALGRTYVAAAAAFAAFHAVPFQKRL